MVGCAGVEDPTMRGTMMDYPLTLLPLLERAGKYFPSVEIISRRKSDP